MVITNVRLSFCEVPSLPYSELSNRSYERLGWVNQFVRLKSKPASSEYERGATFNKAVLFNASLKFSTR
jgi:hypothetical protein